jgi:hypothetical protein
MEREKERVRERAGGGKKATRTIARLRNQGSDREKRASEVICDPNLISMRVA